MTEHTKPPTRRRRPAVFAGASRLPRPTADDRPVREVAGTSIKPIEVPGLGRPFDLIERADGTITLLVAAARATTWRSTRTASRRSPGSTHGSSSRWRAAGRGPGLAQRHPRERRARRRERRRRRRGSGAPRERRPALPRDRGRGLPTRSSCARPTSWVSGSRRWWSGFSPHRPAGRGAAHPARRRLGRGAAVGRRGARRAREEPRGTARARGRRDRRPGGAQPAEGGARVVRARRARGAHPRAGGEPRGPHVPAP